MTSILFGYVEKSVRSASVRFAEEPDTLFKYPYYLNLHAIHLNSICSS